MRKVNWELYTQLEDICIQLDKFLAKIGPKDPVTGCCYPTHGATHKQGYLMINAHYADSIGEETPRRGLMVTGHRVLARLKFKQPLDPSIKVFHSCGDMKCVNIDHIEIGTYKEIGAMMSRLEKKRPRECKFRPGKLETGPEPQSGRAYKYSIEDLLFIRYHEWWEIVQRLGIPKARAFHLKTSVRDGYKWLDKYDMYKTDDWLPAVDITKKRQ